MKNTRKLVFMAMFIAIEIVLTRLLSIMPAANIRISLSFVVYAFAGHLFGPLFGVTSALIGDLVGAILFPPIGGFNLGFTISATLSGFIFGFIEFDKKKTIQTLVIILVNALLVDVTLNTVWLMMMRRTPFFAELISRLPGILVNNGLRILVLLVLTQKVNSGVLHENRYRDRTNR